MRILIAFAIGVCSVLIIVFIANNKIQRLADANTYLDQILVNCGKQRTLSQFLTKNSLLLDYEDELEPVLVRFDSALRNFQENHLQIKRLNAKLTSLNIETAQIDNLYEISFSELTELLKSSYGIQEAKNIETFRARILLHEETFLPHMNQLTEIYEQLAMKVNDELEETILAQYFQIGITVILAASFVLIFTLSLVKARVKHHSIRNEQLLEKKNRYENLLNETHDMVYELSGDGTYVYGNPALERFTGYTLDNLNSKAWYEHVTPEYKDRVLQFYTEVVERKMRTCHFEFPLNTSKGEVKWISQTTDFKYGHDGQVISTYNVAKDITESRQTIANEEKYKKGLRLLNDLSSKTDLSIQERLDDGLKLCLEFLKLENGVISEVWMDEYRIMAMHSDLKKTKTNQKYKLGGTYCDITLKKPDRVFYSENGGKSKNCAHPCFPDTAFETYIGTTYRVDGKVFGTVNFISKAKREQPFTEYEKDFMSLVSKWVGSIIEQRIHQDRMLEEQSLLKTFVSIAPVAIAMFDKHMVYISASKKWKTDQNIKGDIIGKSHYKVFPEIPQEWKKMHQRALQGEVIKPGVEKFERADGSVQWLKGEIHPWYKAKDKVGGIIIFINDLTEIKHQEDELRKAKEEAEAAGRIKEQFLSTMSHEIRTPLNAIIGTTHLLELENPELGGNKRLELLKFGSNNLLTLINDILDFQKIEAGKLEINAEEANLKELCYNIIETWKSVPTNKAINLSFDYGVGLSDVYVFDHTRLTQVLNNLISNALKFTEQGTVKLIVQRTDDNEIHFCVSDTGVGINRENLEQIFESFKQVNAQLALKEGGTGLGLSISKKLVELMGGSLTVNSQVNKGSEFCFNLNFKEAESDKIKPKELKIDDVDLAKKILLVEDNEANQEIAKGFLSLWGIDVVVANNGKEALDQVLSKGFDLILMDMRMPIMNGYEATKTIRKMEDPYFKKVPIIALTASTLSESRAKMKDTGINDIVTKPFDPEDLLKKISALGNKLGKTIKVTKNKSEKPQSIRFKFLYDVLGGDNEQVLEIARMSIASINEGVKGVGEASKKKDREVAHDHLHKMKSNLANLDLKNLSDKIPHYKKDNFWSLLPEFLSEVKEELKKVDSYI